MTDTDPDRPISSDRSIGVDGSIGIDRRIAVVTGGGSGIGAATALGLAAAGWHVVVTGRHQDSLDGVVSTAEQATQTAGRVSATVADVADEGSVSALFASCLRDHGRVDLLFNNAGAGAPDAYPDELTDAQFEAVLATNVTGAFHCSREAFRTMRTQNPRGGRIINNGSLSAHVPRPRSLPYTVTKHAVSGLTQALALDGREFGIACGQIDIGNAATEMTAGMDAGARQADGSRAVEPRIEVGDVVGAVVYMAGLPLSSNVLNLTVMATGMPYVGRG